MVYISKTGSENDSNIGNRGKNPVIRELILKKHGF